MIDARGAKMSAIALTCKLKDNLERSRLGVTTVDCFTGESKSGILGGFAEEFKWTVDEKIGGRFERLIGKGFREGRHSGLSWKIGLER